MDTPTTAERHETGLRPAPFAVITLLLAVGLGGCGTSESTLIERFPALEDSFGFSSCLRKTGDGPDRLTVNVGVLTRHDEHAPGELPDDIVFTDVIGESPAGFDFEPVAVLTEGTAFHDVLLDQNADAANAIEFAPLPYAPGRGETKTISIGVIVDVPAGEVDTPAAIDLRGFRYETGGETYTYDATVDVWVSRQSDDGTYCTAFNCAMSPFDDGCPPGEI